MEDVVATAFPEFSTQDFEAALTTGVLPEFVKVIRTKATHWVKFPTALSRGQPMEYIIFQVYSGHEASIASEHGGKSKNSADPVLFSLFTPETKALQQGRVIKLTSLGFDTTANHVTAALSKYGPIESVRTGFNAKATMATATVTFRSDLAVQSIKEQNKTCLRVRDDVGTLTLLGNETRPSIVTPPPSIEPSTPTLTSPDATDLIFAQAMLALDENCRERLHNASFVHDTAVRNAHTDKQRKQEQITIRLNKDSAKYRKQLVKPVKLAEMLVQMATEETNAKSRQEIPYVQSCAAAAAILRQDTNNIEAFRARRQSELRAELKTRLVRASVAMRLKESSRAKQAQEQAIKKTQR
ncbi:hypothetical protein F5H01DRAFT_363534 [Linnemannia elongata]|nr:hypothetical protein F5H01DRAFT_363534 [Linnemannia elongata]